jgi:hypothetical protein
MKEQELIVQQPIRFVGKRQQGGGYGKPPGRSDDFLTLVEPGTGTRSACRPRSRTIPCACASWVKT